MIPARCLTTCDDDEEDNSRVALILGDKPVCGVKALLMAPKIKLSSGYEMPVLGYGTYKMKGYQCLTAIHCAVETGFRHFDTAFCYENEREVGEAIRTQIQMGNVSRENIFLTTKLWNTHHDPRDVRRICEKQLEALGFDYIDLYLMHFPVGYKHMCDEILQPMDGNKVQTSDVDYIDTWHAMEELVKLGMVRSIGVSNFNMEQVQRIIQCSSSKPVVNQVEIWPGFMQKDLVDYCRYNGIVVTAYAPLGQPDREMHSPIYFFSEGMRRLVKKYKRTAAQIVLRYLIDYGVVPIPKAGNPLHIKQNLNIFDFQLNEADTRALRGIKPKDRLVKFDEIKEHTFYPFEREEEREQQPEEFEQEEIPPKKITLPPTEPAEAEEAEPPVE
ncbi:1,5-anhydro-D-fructose reductase [Drosophila montana]|uniref:1,5-anhydro-D-fructose reductase n=1 Tax=Drosophila montana TaxID=40370 RepID=UPI00313B1FEC